MRRTLITTSRQAEKAAPKWLKDLGYEGSFFVTGGGGDEAIDARGPSVIAAVRNRKEKVSRPAVQTLKGAAAVAGKDAIYFSRSQFF